MDIAIPPRLLHHTGNLLRSGDQPPMPPDEAEDLIESVALAGIASVALGASERIPVAELGDVGERLPEWVESIEVLRSPEMAAEIVVSSDRWTLEFRARVRPQGNSLCVWGTSWRDMEPLERGRSGHVYLWETHAEIDLGDRFVPGEVLGWLFVPHAYIGHALVYRLPGSDDWGAAWTLMSEVDGVFQEDPPIRLPRSFETSQEGFDQIVGLMAAVGIGPTSGGHPDSRIR